MLEGCGSLVGRIIVATEAANLYVVAIAVPPNAQIRGVGGAAVAAVQCEAVVAKLGIRTMVLADNRPSLAMFRQCGFAPTGREAGPPLELRWTA